MDTVKSLFGVLFLAVAVYLVAAAAAAVRRRCCYGRCSRSLSGFWVFSLKARDGAPAPLPLRGLGLIAVVYGILLLDRRGIGRQGSAAAAGARLAAGRSVARARLGTRCSPSRRIKTVADLENARGGCNRRRQSR